MSLMLLLIQIIYIFLLVIQYILLFLLLNHRENFDNSITSLKWFLYLSRKLKKFFPCPMQNWPVQCPLILSAHGNVCGLLQCPSMWNFVRRLFKIWSFQRWFWIFQMMKGFWDPNKGHLVEQKSGNRSLFYCAIMFGQLDFYVQ